MPQLNESARDSLLGDPIWLEEQQAIELLAQFHETCNHRKWLLAAVAIMRAHIHVLLGVPGDPKPDSLLGGLKAYGSRELNRLYGVPASGTWWTESGSKKRKRDLPAILNAVDYIAKQENPLVIWINPVTVTWR